MKRRRRRIQVESSGNQSEQLLSLSLFIMLLAFFIVLNSISSFEETKVKPIVSSIEQSFAIDETADADQAPSNQESKKASDKEGDTLDKLKALFSSYIPSYDSAANKREGTMYVRLPFADFENAVMAVGGDQAAQAKAAAQSKMKGFFLPALLAVMRSDQYGTPYRMDMVMNIGENPAVMQNDEPQQAKRAMRRISRLSDRLERAGMPSKLQSIGLGDGPKDTIDLLFRRHVPYDPTGEEEPGANNSDANSPAEGGVNGR